MKVILTKNCVTVNILYHMNFNGTCIFKFYNYDCVHKNISPIMYNIGDCAWIYVFNYNYKITCTRAAGIKHFRYSLMMYLLL